MGQIKELLVTFKNSLDEEYGSTENQDKSTLVVAFGMLLLSATFFCLIIFSPNEDQVLAKILFGYFACVMFSISLLMSALYFFGDKVTAAKNRKIKYIYFSISIFIFLIAFFPFTLFMMILDITKSPNVWKYSAQYGITFIISLVLSMFTGGFIWRLLHKIYFLNLDVIIIFFSFVAFFCFMNLGMWIYFKFKKRKINKKSRDASTINSIVLGQLEACESDRQQIKKELYVFIFIVISLISTVALCVNWQLVVDVNYSEIVKNIVNSTLHAFALYIAFDRVMDKWRKVHRN